MWVCIQHNVFAPSYGNVIQSTYNCLSQVSFQKCVKWQKVRISGEHVIWFTLCLVCVCSTHLYGFESSFNRCTLRTVTISFDFLRCTNAISVISSSFSHNINILIAFVWKTAFNVHVGDNDDGKIDTFSSLFLCITTANYLLLTLYCNSLQFHPLYSSFSFLSVVWSCCNWWKDFRFIWFFVVYYTKGRKTQKMWILLLIFWKRTKSTCSSMHFFIQNEWKEVIFDVERVLFAC